MDDDKILQMYLERDENAIEKTSEKYGALCNSLAFGILKNRQDAEECVNDTFLRVWQSVPPEKPKMFSAYLAKITRNLAVDRYRRGNTKKRSSPQYELAIEELEECVGKGDVEQYIDESITVGTINSFLETLDSKKRRVFLRRYFYFDSIKDISERYGMSQSSVKMVLKRARESLKECLEKEGIEI